MAKKRKTSRSRKPARARAVKTGARRKSARRGKSGDVDPMNVIAVVLVLVLVGLGIYLYQINHKEGAAMSGNPPAAAVEKK